MTAPLHVAQRGGLETAHRRAGASMTAPAHATVDLLEQAINRARPLLRTGTTKERIRLLWAAAKNARPLGAEDVVEAAFLELAIEVGLIDERGWWTGQDVRADIRRHGRQDVIHVLRWAARSRNPFERRR
jgi:hypothetical protein